VSPGRAGAGWRGHASPPSPPEQGAAPLGRLGSPSSLRSVAALVVALVVALAACATAPAVSSTPGPAACRAFVGGTVIARPDAEPLRDGVVLVCGATLAAVGARQEVAVPAGAVQVDARGTTLVAGLWNSHLHLTEPAFEGAAGAPAEALAAALEELTTRWGFVHVVDLGSDPRDSGALKRRLARGEVRGPSLRLAAGPFVAADAQPAYVPVPLPQLRTPAQATRAVQAALDDGADAIKLMTASVVARPPSPVMPVEVVRAATSTAHARGALVLAHPTNRAGVEAARLGGVDVLAHTAPEDGPWSDAEARALVASGLSLIPTLSLWRRELAEQPQLAARFEADAVQQVRAFHAAGGTLLFGTDAGYRPEHDPALEYALLTRAGLSWREQLEMLTTAPAARFGASASTGRLAPGLDADLVLLEGDLTADPAALGRVRCALRQGVVVHGGAACAGR
jgi:imidazolonepropionase-like amidohydrolase